MKYGYFRASAMFMSVRYRIPTLARYLPIQIEHTEAGSNFKSPKLVCRYYVRFKKSYSSHVGTMSALKSLKDHILSTIKSDITIRRKKFF